MPRYVIELNEKPKTCLDCPFINEDVPSEDVSKELGTAECGFIGNVPLPPRYETREPPEWCPIVAVD